MTKRPERCPECDANGVWISLLISPHSEAGELFDYLCHNCKKFINGEQLDYESSS